jgi:hypothetical protein
MTVKKVQKKLFGTNGVRGIIGKDLTPDLVFSHRRSIRFQCGKETIAVWTGLPGPQGENACQCHEKRGLLGIRL